MIHQFLLLITILHKSILYSKPEKPAVLVIANAIFFFTSQVTYFDKLRHEFVPGLLSDVFKVSLRESNARRNSISDKSLLNF